MPNRPGNDDRITAHSGNDDRGGQRDASNDTMRQNTGAMTGATNAPTTPSSASTGGSQSAAPNASQNGAKTAAPTRTRSNRGFASMDRAKQKEIASKGGKAAHAKGTAHEFDSGEAREAGRKGGVAVSRNREHMAAIGRRGGEARGQSRNRNGAQTNTGGSGSTPEGSFQNSRAGSASTERQVAIDNQSESRHADAQGNRGGNSSLGGERRPANSTAPANTQNTVSSDRATTRNETFGNH